MSFRFCSQFIPGQNHRRVTAAGDNNSSSTAKQCTVNGHTTAAVSPQKPTQKTEQSKIESASVVITEQPEVHLAQSVVHNTTETSFTFSERPIDVPEHLLTAQAANNGTSTAKAEKSVEKKSLDRQETDTVIDGHIQTEGNSLLHHYTNLTVASLL